MRLLFTLLFLVSCSTTSVFTGSDERVEIVAMTGSSFDYVQDKWGKADKEIVKGKRKKFFIKMFASTTKTLSTEIQL